MRSVCLAVLLLFVVAGPVHIAQEAPGFESYNALFDAFQKRRDEVLTRLDKLQGREKVDPDEYQRLVGELKALDLEYAQALAAYIEKRPTAEDIAFARYELILTLSKFDEKLQEAADLAAKFPDQHPDSELIPQVRFARAQSLFRIPGREEAALEALDDFLKRHSGIEEADFARTMRVRALLYLDRVDDARKALSDILELPKVKADEAARSFLQKQLKDLDWIGKDLPLFALSDTSGKAWVNDDFRGGPLLLFVWDSNSAVCLEELSFVNALNVEFRSRGLRVLGLSVNKSEAALTQHLKKSPLEFSNCWIDRNKENTLVRKLEVDAIPFNVLVDARGKVYRYDVRSDDLRRYARRMLG